jgi:hypothetical protein
MLATTVAMAVVHHEWFASNLVPNRTAHTAARQLFWISHIYLTSLNIDTIRELFINVRFRVETGRSIKLHSRTYRSALLAAKSDLGFSRQSSFLSTSRQPLNT